MTLGALHDGISTLRWRSEAREVLIASIASGRAGCHRSPQSEPGRVPAVTPQSHPGLISCPRPSPLPHRLFLQDTGANAVPHPVPQA